MSFMGKQFPRLTAAINRSSRTLRLYCANRSLRAWRQLVSCQLSRLAGRPVPVFLDIATTYRCQCRCVHCAAEMFGGTDTADMTTAQLKSLIDQASRLGVLEIIFSGWEPAMLPDAQLFITPQGLDPDFTGH